MKPKNANKNANKNEKMYIDMLFKKGYVDTVRNRVIKLLKKSGKGNPKNKKLTQNIRSSKPNDLLKPIILDSDVHDIKVKKYLSHGANGLVFLNNINLKKLFPHLKGDLKAVSKTEINEFGSKGDDLEYEFKVSLIINMLREYIPNFMFTYAVINCKSNIPNYTEFYEDSNNTKKLVNKSMCEKNGKFRNLFTISEYSGDISLRDYIHESIKDALSIKNHVERVKAVDFFFVELVHLYCQILSAMAIAYNRMGIVHNDLHNDNILLRNCCYKSGNFNKYIYNLGKERITTYSQKMPTIIDFGRTSMNKTILKKYGLDTSKYCTFEKNKHMCKADDEVATDIRLKNRTRDIVLVSAHILKKLRNKIVNNCSPYIYKWYTAWVKLFYLNYPDILVKKRGKYIGYTIHDVSALPRNNKNCITSSKDVVMFFKPFLDQTGKMLASKKMETFEYNKTPKKKGFESELKNKKKLCLNKSKKVSDAFKTRFYR
jgi:hypothetical protein